jgi:hypothetical protein
VRFLFRVFRNAQSFNRSGITLADALRTLVHALDLDDAPVTMFLEDDPEPFQGHFPRTFMSMSTAPSRRREALERGPRRRGMPEVEP